ncbi:MAG TPA: YeeE/YedE thiosulfate transporter family protein [Symbiobacteriaceae bacterium]|nr:YeeE/YedE thiosulfate transporter family protein [Symbiobacteriaceae bacterium]
MTWLRRLIVPAIIAIIVTGFTALLLTPAPASADCGGDVSSCKSCHEGDQKMPVNTIGLWHTQHAFSDFCANCHLGDIAAKEAEPAHLGMRPVMADPKASCEACHASDYEAKAATYTEEKETQAPVAAVTPPQFPPPGSGNNLFIIINIAVLAGLAALVWAVEKGPLQKLKVSKPRPMAGGQALSWNPLAWREWSPYWAGAGLGLVAVAALWLSEQPLGSSGAYLTIDSLLLKATGSSLADSVYFKMIMPPKITWQLLLVAGVVLGALISALWSRDFRVESVPDRWAQVFGQKRWKRWLAMFFGAMILQFGASIAGGCTSGLAIAGSLQLAGAGFLFIGALFATGIITAKLLYGRDY